MSAFELAELEGMNKLGVIVLHDTVGLMFKFDTAEHAKIFAASLEKNVEDGHVEFKLVLGSRVRIQ